MPAPRLAATLDILRRLRCSAARWRVCCSTSSVRASRSRIGYLFARDAFQALREKMDPGKGNGGVFLGLTGIVIKSHGGTDAEGFASAVDVGYDMVRYDLLTKINQTLNRDGTASRL